MTDQANENVNTERGAVSSTAVLDALIEIEASANSASNLAEELGEYFIVKHCADICRKSQKLRRQIEGASNDGDKDTE